MEIQHSETTTVIFDQMELEKALLDLMKRNAPITTGWNEATFQFFWKDGRVTGVAISATRPIAKPSNAL